MTFHFVINLEEVDSFFPSFSQIEQLPRYTFSFCETDSPNKMTTVISDTNFQVDILIQQFPEQDTTLDTGKDNKKLSFIYLENLPDMVKLRGGK